jgi:hypothetical protein
MIAEKASDLLRSQGQASLKLARNGWIHLTCLR